MANVQAARSRTCTLRRAQDTCPRPPLPRAPTDQRPLCQSLQLSQLSHLDVLGRKAATPAIIRALLLNLDVEKVARDRHVDHVVIPVEANLELARVHHVQGPDVRHVGEDEFKLRRNLFKKSVLEGEEASWTSSSIPVPYEYSSFRAPLPRGALQCCVAWRGVIRHAGKAPAALRGSRGDKK